MSYSEVETGAWEVRWRQGGKNKSQRVASKLEAQELDAEKKRAKKSKFATTEYPRQTFKKLSEDVWDRRYAGLMPRTREDYVRYLDKIIGPHLNGYYLEELTPDILEDWLTTISRTTGSETVRKCVTLLRSILDWGVKWNRLPSNPAAHLEKPKKLPTPELVPLAPVDIWRLANLLRTTGDEQSAVLTEILGFAGLRPEEAHALTWGHVRDRTLRVEQRVSRGVVYPGTKNGKPRDVFMLAPLAKDLAKYKMRSGRPSDSSLIFPRFDGRCWQQHDVDNWRKRTFGAAAMAIGFTETRTRRVEGRTEHFEAASITPYHLRHSFASLLLHEGKPAIYVAKQLGHSMQVLDDTYGHLIANLGDICSAEQAVKEAQIEAVAA